MSRPVLAAPAFAAGALVVVFAFALTCGAGGCGPADDFSHVGVSGKVTVDGQPLPDGTIAFIPLGSGPAAQGSVAGGAYRIPRSDGPGAGEYRVEVNRIEPTGRKVPDPENNAQMLDETRNTIPPRYNRDSVLRAQVKSGGDQTFDFDLKPAAKSPAAR